MATDVKHSFQSFDFTIIGFGRVGACLARSLSKIGGTCIGVASSDPAKLDDAQSGIKFPLLPRENPEYGHYCFICVPDDFIEEQAGFLADSLNGDTAATFIHVSGARSSLDLMLLKQKGCRTASFHPLQTFHPTAGPETFNDILVSVEGDEQVLPSLAGLAQKLGARTMIVTPDQKKAMHIAAVVVSNFQSALVLEASGVLGTHFENPVDFIRKNYAHLMQQTMLNILKKGFPDALTGPASRNDQNTMRMHKDYLQHHGQNAALYAELSAVIMRYISENKPK